MSRRCFRISSETGSGQASSQALIARKTWSGHTEYSQEFLNHTTALHVAAYFGLKVIVQLLLQQGANFNAADSYGRTPLSYATEEGHEAVVTLLLEELETKDDEDGRTPLSYAAVGGHEAVVTLLLEKGAELDAKDNDGRTPLSHAAQNGHESIVKLLTFVLVHQVAPLLVTAKLPDCILFLSKFL